MVSSGSTSTSTLFLLGTQVLPAQIPQRANFSVAAFAKGVLHQNLPYA